MKKFIVIIKGTNIKEELDNWNDFIRFLHDYKLKHYSYGCMNGIITEKVTLNW